MKEDKVVCFLSKNINQALFKLEELVKIVELLMRALFIFSATFLDPKLDSLVTVLERLGTHA